MSFIRRQSIEVVDYDPAWPKLFEEIRARIELLLLGLVTEIHHIGSTSVPGLCAKPKIDIDIIFRQPAEIPEGIARMQATGDYTFHGELYQDNRWVFTTSQVSPGQRLYLSAPEHPAHLHRILFRDYLRRHPEEAATYATLKQRLAAEAINEWDHYTGGKGPFVTDIVNRAMAENSLKIGR